MKKGISFIIVTFLLVFAVTQASYGWQGRMAGMGDPYGLVVDPSDFIIHPSKLKHEDKVKYKFHYRFNYTEVSEWNYDYNLIDPGTGSVDSYYNYDTDGDRQTHNGTLGATFPAGDGSMGIFITYGGQWGDYSGDVNYDAGFGPFIASHEFESDLSNPSLKLVYSWPVNSVDLGVEAGVAYHSEENETIQTDQFSNVYVNWYSSAIIDRRTFHTYMVPYDSEYWTAFFKGSIAGTYNRTDLAFTVGGGGIFAGDNTYLYQWTGNGDHFEMDGDVEGWETRADFWLRYHQNDRTSFPFMVRVQYQRKTRDGAGPN
ncbi:hypothetical protein ACFL03_16765, partial [Thermodesulfobacteriota bacterium]